MKTTLLFISTVVFGLLLLAQPPIPGKSAGPPRHAETARVGDPSGSEDRYSFTQGPPPQGAADQPYTMEYYYKLQWGHQQEFLQLFLKNHYPLLKKEVESGRMLSVKIETPANHMTEDARWDYRVTIRFKNSTAATTSNPDEAALIKQLWPDQETYKREEQRRFEILLAHWDLPVTDVTPKP